MTQHYRDFDVGDRVRIQYIMGEDSSPYWSDGGVGTIIARSGPDYCPDYTVERDSDGAHKTISGVSSSLAPAK